MIDDRGAVPSAIDLLDNKITNQKLVYDFKPFFSDGFRSDKDGNIWTSAGKAIKCFNPKNELIGQILVPELVSNLEFGGKDGNILYMLGVQDENEKFTKLYFTDQKPHAIIWEALVAYCDEPFKTLNSSKDPDLEQLEINFKVIDHNSTKENLEAIDNVFNKFRKKYSLINLDVSKFIGKIEKINQRGEKVTDNQISNMANIHQSLLEAKKCEDLIYFVEDDYIHKKESLKEMIFTYERLASQINNEIIICPTDYPYLYAKSEMTQNFLGQNYHWRKVNETLCTFLTSKKMIEKYWDKYVSMCEKEHAPFEKPLHDIYKKELCLSPIPSLALHFTNVNSIFGLSPNVNWKKIWDQNEN